LIPPRGERRRDLHAQAFDRVPGIDHPVDVCAHRLRRDAGQVVADRQVEDVGTGVGSDERAELVPSAEDLDDHPRLDVLLEGLADPELLAHSTL
jgi:hypothetical protein